MNEAKYKLTEDNQIVVIETGELITKKTFNEDMKEWFIKQYDIYALASLNFGEKLNFTVKKILNREYHVTNPKENYTFVKVFKVEVRNIMNNNNKFDNLNIYEKGTLATLEAHLSFPDNSVVVDGETPQIEKLTKVIGMGKTKLYEVLALLEKKELIKRVKLQDRTIIYLNPFLYSCGLVKKETMELFEKSIYNPENKN